MDSKQIRRQYLQALPKLNAALQFVQDKLTNLPASDFAVEINMKPYSSVQKKVVKDKLDNILQMSDLVRGRVFFSKKYIFSDLLKLLKSLLGKTIKKTDKKNTSEDGLEYCGIMHLDLLIDGIKFELQLIPEEFKPYKELLHNIYEKIRSGGLSDKQKYLLRTINNKLYHTLDNKAKENRRS